MCRLPHYYPTSKAAEVSSTFLRCVRIVIDCLLLWRKTPHYLPSSSSSKQACPETRGRGFPSFRLLLGRLTDAFHSDPMSSRILYHSVGNAIPKARVYFFQWHWQVNLIRQTPV
jgi:hypothetical protein